ncbi:polyphosphate kinase 2 family protein [Microcoleus sp. FACHB-1515]|uniref:polyphosphate kinase 2 family protein n=1 Tax=Cyanophyceae TaxID=3028117 RepID=UPI001682709E|nr:polyphosphate kinase 2 family protein [Microcoleus sp. FACHB-1515]MBD2090758.1 polyphosphate kinase 2 family protein [Microcoleus sp. FACHB-1515]
MNHDRLIVKPGTKISLKDFDSGYTDKYKDKAEAAAKLKEDLSRLQEYQDVLYAQDTYALLLIFQAMDAAGKDGTIKHVMSGVNPQGCQVYSFKAPSAEDLDHDFLWRTNRCLPERGRIGIFNRSYYEEVLVVRVHPELLERQQLPKSTVDDNIWKHRFEDINNSEKYLTRNGIVILKFFLNVSKAEQKKRFMARINEPEKNWKFSASDAKERLLWDDYMKAYEDMLSHTSTEAAPWHVIPADHKWFMHLAVANVICTKLKSMKLTYPTLSDRQKENLIKAKEMLESE